MQLYPQLAPNPTIKKDHHRVDALLTDAYGRYLAEQISNQQNETSASAQGFDGLPGRSSWLPEATTARS
jgi:hypothetical protein